MFKKPEPEVIIKEITSEPNSTTLDAIFQLMVKHKVDTVEYGNFKITKSYHEIEEVKKKQQEPDLIGWAAD